MKIETTDNCILARLSSEELDSFMLTCDELNSSDERAKKVLKIILDEIQAETGNSLTLSGGLKIEVLPDCSGGCLVLFMPLHEEDAETSVYETADIDNLLDLILVLRKEKELAEKSELFEKDGLYRLTVCGESKRLSRILNEYLSPVFSDITEPERTEETFRCIMKNNALEILCGTFS